MSVSKEVRANSAKFMQSWNDQAQKNWNEIQKSDKIIESYQRIAVFNSLRVDILEKCLSKDSYLFVKEAHNDLLTCHVSASLGSWRSALQCLRGFIENSLSAFYYMDHPIELEKWNIGSHRLGFSDMKGYFGTHPKLMNIDVCKEAIAKISVEYSTLSQAVHGSAKSFRMTDDVSTTLLRSEEHTSELQSLMRISYAVFCLQKKKKSTTPLIRKLETRHS